MESDVRRVAMTTPRELSIFITEYEDLLDESDLIKLCNKLLNIAVEYRYDLNHDLPKTIVTDMHIKVDTPEVEIITSDTISEEVFNRLLVPVIEYFITHSLIHQYTLESFYVTYVSTSQILLKYKEKL